MIIAGAACLVNSSENRGIIRVALFFNNCYVLFNAFIFNKLFLFYNFINPEGNGICAVFSDKRFFVNT